MEMSFFVSCPVTGGISVPRKSRHTRNADLTIVCHGSGYPDLSGPAGALLLGRETKKDISMLCSEFLSWITLMRSVGVICYTTLPLLRVTTLLLVPFSRAWLWVATITVVPLICICFKRAIISIVRS